MLQNNAAPKAAVIELPYRPIAAAYHNPTKKRNQHWWQPEEVTRLVELWVVKKSTNEIASILAVEFNRPFTKNMVIGCAHRIGLPTNKIPKKDRSAEVNYAKRKHVRTSGFVLPTPKPRPTQLPFLGLTFQQLERRQCKYPTGDGPFLFCGQPAIDDSPYCAYCHDLTHTEARRPMRPVIAAHSPQMLEAAE